MRTFAHAAWVTPLVQAVGRASTHAASNALTIASAAFWWKDWSMFDPAEYAVSPLVTVRNDSAVATTDLRISLHFPPSYVGFCGSGVVLPYIVNWMGPGWSYAIDDPDAGGTTVGFSREPSAAQLAPGTEIALGTWEPRSNPFGISWSSMPQDPISVAVTATGFATAAGVLTEVPPLA